MNMLRMLGIEQSYDCRISCHYDTFKYMSNKLHCLIWKSYPWESLPDNFQPRGLVHLVLDYSKLRHLWKGAKDLRYLQKLDLSWSKRLIETPDFKGMPNLKHLDLSGCIALEEVHQSLGLYCRKLIQLYLNCCESLKRIPCINVESLEYLSLEKCYRLEKFPGILGRMKSQLEIEIQNSGIRELPSSIYQYRTHITRLCLCFLKNLATLPSSICNLKRLVILELERCSKLESLPEEIGDLENLEKLNASFTLISQPPSSIIRLNKLKSLNFQKLTSGAKMYFLFPRVNEGLRSLEVLDLSYCNLNDGGLPEDIGCLSSLRELDLKGNIFDHLPRSIAQLGALEVLNVSYCKWLVKLPELPPNVQELWADCRVTRSIQSYENLKCLVFTKPLRVDFDDLISNLFAQTLLKCILSLRKAQRVFYIFHPATKIPIWFKYHSESENDLLVKLPENWYANGNFLGFAICFSGFSYESTVELIPLSNDDNSEKLSKNLDIPYMEPDGVKFYFIPLVSLWDMSKANGKTPNAYGHLKFSTAYSNVNEFGLRLLYEDDPEFRFFDFC